MLNATEGQLRRWRGIAASDPLGLVIMLHDGAVEQLNRACALQAPEERAARTELIANVQRILTELLCSLREGADPQLAASLAALYEHLHGRLTVTALVEDDRALVEVAEALEALGDAWRQAAPCLRATDDGWPGLE
ncbi:MAG: flagellar export chaperone FliS [Armatimonadota bacterium]